jgi:hypothetical protein
LAQTLRANKGTASTCDHLLEGCARLGTPDLLQLDTDAAFTGLGRTPRVFGRFVRLALDLGLEVLFLPPSEAKRHHGGESVHGTWAASFWNKNPFTALRDLERPSPKFFAWYADYAPEALDGLTVKQAARHLHSKKLLRRQLTPIPPEVPLTASRVHFIRKVDARGAIHILTEPWQVSKSLVGHYVWATLDTGKAALSSYHRHSERAQPRLIKQYGYAIEEKGHKRKPEFHRRARKIDSLTII